jgi:hypothetical protein
MTVLVGGMRVLNTNIEQFMTKKHKVCVAAEAAPAGWRHCKETLKVGPELVLLSERERQPPICRS